MRTLVYIDGYNLYYGRLQGSPYKWLDVGRLAQEICGENAPASRIERVCYFTSPVIARLATHGVASVEAQNAYLRALMARNVDVILGRHQLENGYAPRYIEGSAPVRRDRAAIWVLAEKETDTRIALTVYRDVLHRQPTATGPHAAPCRLDAPSHS